MEIFGKEYYQIKDYPNYLISKDADVYSVKRNKTLSPAKMKKGYLMVVLYNENGPKVQKIHRLIAQTFIPNPNNELCVNHKDMNKLNNNVENLEWISFNENAKHARLTRKKDMGWGVSKFVGVSYKKKRRRWVAEYPDKLNNKKIFIGHYKTEQEAIDAVCNYNKKGVINEYSRC